MRTFVILCVAFAALAAVSGFIHPSHHMHDTMPEESHETTEHSTDSTEHNSTHHHHPHHHSHHHSHHGHHHHHKHLMCKGEPVKPSHELMKAKKECCKEFKDAKKNNVADRQRGRVCKSLCAGKKIGFFDEEGQVVQSKVNELIESMIVSTEAQKLIKEKAALCAKNITEAIADGPSDNKCSNYKPYVKCLWLSSMEVCVKDFDPEDWE